MGSIFSIVENFLEINIGTFYVVEKKNAIKNSTRFQKFICFLPNNPKILFEIREFHDEILEVENFLKINFYFISVCIKTDLDNYRQILNRKY